MTENSQTPIRVGIVDDHLIVREGLRLILETGTDIEIVGDAADGVAALELAATTSPDVMLLDLRMPTMDGLTTLTQLRAQWPTIKVIILTTYNEDELMLRGLRAGAYGYLLKDVGRETLLAAIRTAARGEMLLQPEIVARLLTQNVSPAARADASTAEVKGTLTERELTILAAAAQGERSKEIAATLGITERTVRGHLSNIYNKLGVDSRTAAVAVALKHGLLSDQD